jgi:3-hydroxyisobutyrate dehydrogenase
MKIGVIGIGKMGAAICSRLISLGHEVHVWNRTQSNAQVVISLGAIWAPSPAQLVHKVEVVLSLLANENALDEVYSSQSGLLSTDLMNKTIIEMSTVSPEKHLTLANQVAHMHGEYLECPVGGSVGPAKEGKLIGFVGGPQSSFEKQKPLLEQLCKRVEHLGNYGSGSTMKLAINLPLMVYWQTLSEALTLIQPLGLDPLRVIDIISDTSGGPNVLKARGTFVAQTIKDRRASNVNVSMNTVLKDVQTMLKHAEKLNKQLPLTQTAFNTFQTSCSTGLENADCCEHIVWWLTEGSKA